MEQMGRQLGGWREEMEIGVPKEAESNQTALVTTQEGRGSGQCAQTESGVV